MARAMRVKELPVETVWEVAYLYVTQAYMTMEKLSRKYGVSRNTISKILHRAIEDLIVSDDMAKKIRMKAIDNADYKVGAPAALKVKKSFDESLKERNKKRDLDTLKKYEELKKKADASQEEGSSCYVEPRVEQISFWNL